MKFSMNGFRRNLSGDVKSLRDIVEAIINDEYWEKEDLIVAANQIITHSNVVNCVYDNNDSDFTDMSDVEVEHIDRN